MHFKIKGDKFQLCETVNKNVQKRMNYLDIAISVLGNDQDVTDFLSVRKVKCLPKYLSMSVCPYMPKIVISQ